MDEQTTQPTTTIEPDTPERIETRGRPAESLDGAPRGIRKVRFSDTEWAWLVEQARADGVSTSEFIRRRALRGATRAIRATSAAASSPEPADAAAT